MPFHANTFPGIVSASLEYSKVLHIIRKREQHRLFFHKVPRYVLHTQATKFHPRQCVHHSKYLYGSEMVKWLILTQWRLSQPSWLHIHDSNSQGLRDPSCMALWPQMGPCSSVWEPPPNANSMNVSRCMQIVYMKWF